MSSDGWLTETNDVATESPSHGLVDLAMGLSPVGTVDTHDALRYLERDVLDRWRGALADRDAARVVQLVEICHALREALRVAPTALRDGLVT